MADNTKAVTVAATATQIVPVNQKRKTLVIHNNGATDVFLGFTSADCTTASSMPLGVGCYVTMKNKADTIYGIVASGTAEVRVWEDQHG